MELPEDILMLIEKYLNATISEAELETLNTWYRAYSDSEARVDLSSLPQDLSGIDGDQSEAALSKRIFDQLTSRLEEAEERQPAVKRRRLWQYAAAAVLLLLIASATYRFFQRPVDDADRSVRQDSQQTGPQDLAPGSNKAKLRLADGTVVLLDDLHSGTVAHQQDVDIQKTGAGQLSYLKAGGQQESKVVTNQISTPRGGTYQITLTDGTKVWLNAATELTFPTTFTGQSREVHLTGQAYFEVAKNARQPFLVHTPRQTIRVLGTHFDVNAYPDEKLTKTTLLEGKVSIQANTGQNNAMVLSPGQQATINANGQVRLDRHPDLEQVMGWKNGYFVFQSTDLKSILRLISRWYDADIVYDSQENPVFTGQISKTLPLSKVFALLSLTNVIHYQIKGNQITVTLP